MAKASHLIREIEERLLSCYRKKALLSFDIVKTDFFIRTGNFVRGTYNNLLSRVTNKKSTDIFAKYPTLKQLFTLHQNGKKLKKFRKTALTPLFEVS